MLVGLVGKPSSGKSTFFSAATLVDVPIAAYPFTTIDPNKGVTYVKAECPHASLGLKECNPKNSKCENGVRLIPMGLLDVAGLVPKAHEGKGLGNKFLDDLRAADALIQIVDASGKTDAEGKECDSFDPCEEIRFLEEEIVFWMRDIIKRGWTKVRTSKLPALAELLSGLKVTEQEVSRAAHKLGLSTEKMEWSDDEILSFAREVRKESKPILIAANKIDLPGAKENYERMRKEFPGRVIIPCSAASELALRKAVQSGAIRYVPGDDGFEVLKELPEKQAKGLEFIRKNILEEYGGTGVQKLVDAAVFDVLKLIAVYPVEDEHKFANNFGKVLPDAFLLRKGSTVLDLAGKVHSDLAKNFVSAVNCRTKMRVGKDHELEMNDVIKIISASRKK